MADFGYDVEDFKSIDPLFGNMTDFQQLLEAAHAVGLKLILDFIPNHSSNQHYWFNKSVHMEDPYTDYYVWVDPKGVDERGEPIPPSNWVLFSSTVTVI